MASGRLPPPLMTSEIGSFARATIVERKPQIIGQVLNDFAYPPEIVQALEVFRDEITRQPMQALREDAPDAAAWNAQLARLVRPESSKGYAGKTWLEVPWYWAEVYFYRKLLEAVRYFQPGPWQGVDPFGPQKRRQEAEALQRLNAGYGQLEDLEPAERFELLLHSCLWGNRADLSNLTVKEQAHAGLATRGERHNILIDHSEQIMELLAGGVRRVDFINDNVGLDLLFDLALADFLLATGTSRGDRGNGWAGRCVFHLKPQPFFVSDAMPVDAEIAVQGLESAAGPSLLSGRTSPAVQRLGRRLATHLARGRLAFVSDPFWTNWLMFRDFPVQLRDDLAQADLVLLKGDVNYRRLLDDAHWPHETPLEEVTGYFPAPFATLRTLKGEIMVGLAPGQAGQLAMEDPAWLINGKLGVIHFVRPGTRSTP